MIGTQVGPYAVLSKLGEGGMGTVYLARDPKLNRDVALKTLGHAVAGDADRLARFRREAQVLAALNHPNIGQIFGLEDSGPSPVLVLELVEGPTLADMLSAPLPVAEAVAIARQIADALEFAHERGIIHRDLKPANVKVRPDGTVKVLDFGLAKALDPSSQSAAPASGSPNPALLSQSPTMTSAAFATGYGGPGTQMGMILGTAAYMAPEQAKGRPLDRRADIWAFGVVLYEMLTGRRAYQGEDVADSLAAVLTREVDWTSLPAGVPPRLRTLLADCLVRDPKNRLRDIGDARRVLDQIASGAPEPAAPTATSAVATPARRWTLVVPWAIATVALLTAGISVWRGSRSPAPALPAPVIRTQSTIKTFAGFVTLSADATKLVYAVNDANGTALVLRNMDQIDGRIIPGSSGGVFAVMSPDTRWIAFTIGGSKIRKMPIEGGTSVALADGAFTFGADWGDDGTIVFSGEKGLMRVAAAGGTAESLTTVNRDQHELAHRRPQFLPGGRGVLFTIVPSDGSAPQFAVVDTSSPTPTVRKVASGGDNGRYVPSGHLTYVRDTTLFAVPFDIDTLTVTGPETAIVESVSTFGPDGTGDYTFSRNGVLMYVQGTGLRGSLLAWVDAKGIVAGIPGQVTREWGTGSLSPDGRQVANAISDGAEHEIWIVDLLRGVSIRVTTGSAGDNPIWTPDGRRVIYSSSVGGAFGLSSVDVDGSGTPRRVLTTPKEARPSAISADGRTLLYRTVNEAGVAGTFVAPMNDDGTAGTSHPLRPGSANDTNARLSRDGKWVAFQSNQSGDQAVYLMPFPGPGGVTRVSTGRGVEPRWSRDGRQVFFWETTNRSTLWSATVATTPSLSIGAPTKVFDLPGGSGTTWDVAPDGRFLVERPPGGVDPSTTLVTVTNWFDELRRRAPPAKK